MTIASFKPDLPGSEAIASADIQAAQAIIGNDESTERASRASGFPSQKERKPPAPISSNLSQGDMRLLPTASNPLQQRMESRAIYDEVLAVGCPQG